MTKLKKHYLSKKRRACGQDGNSRNCTLDISEVTCKKCKKIINLGGFDDMPRVLEKINRLDSVK